MNSAFQIHVIIFSSIDKNLKKVEKEHELVRAPADPAQLATWADKERELKLIELLRLSTERKYLLGLVRKYAGMHCRVTSF
jgi:hypothetical protein